MTLCKVCKQKYARSDREHGQAYQGKFFIKCACGEKQATLRDGSPHVFDTSVDKGGESQHVSLRLAKSDHKEMKKRPETARQLMEYAIKHKPHEVEE